MKNRAVDQTSQTLDRLVVAGYKVHLAAALFPALGPAEHRELVADLVAYGQREPILRWRGEHGEILEGEIIDGVNRLRACEEAGITPWIADFHGTAREVIDHIWSLNGVRRHMPAAQKALIRLQLDDVVRDYQRALKVEANHRRGKRGKAVGNKIVPDAAPEPPRKKTKELLAELAGVSIGTAQKALSVQSKAPERVPEILAGTTSLDEVYRELPRARYGDDFVPDEACEGQAEIRDLFQSLKDDLKGQEAPDPEGADEDPEADVHQVRHTPFWVVQSLLKRLSLPGGHWLDPCCGHMDLAEAVMTTDAAARIERWTMFDIRQAAIDVAKKTLEDWPRQWRRKGRVMLDCRDWLAVPPGVRSFLRDVQVAILNPPWWSPKGDWRSPLTGLGMRQTSIALEFVEEIWKRCPEAHVVMLHALRLFDGVGRHGGMSRAKWFAEHMPDEYRLSTRVAFTGPQGEELPGEYAGPVVWFHWPPDGRNRTEGIVRVLTG